MWQPQLAAVPDGWRVVAPDLAGLGGSADHTGKPSIDDFAHDLDDLAHHLGLRHFVLGGLSMGGYAVFAYLRLNPSRVKGIVLADTKSGADTPQARDGRQKMLDLVGSKGVGAIADEMVPKLVGPTTQRAAPAVVSNVRSMIEANTAEGVSRAIQRLRDRPDATPQLSRITIPALVIVGEEDGITPVADARAMASALPEATLAVLPRAGHLSNLEAPDAFGAAVAPWLAAF
jgi:pimeloyl-ACP methyl ester carboxylesterase